MPKEPPVESKGARNTKDGKFINTETGGTKKSGSQINESAKPGRGDTKKK